MNPALYSARDYPNKGRTEGDCRHFEVLGVCGYGQCLKRSLDPDKTKRGFAWDRACTGDFEERIFRVPLEAR
jgi:hypothetical protein